MAAEDLIGTIEERRAKADSEQRRCWTACLCRGLNTVDRARDVLRVVKGVVKVRAELQFHFFIELEILEDREIEVVNAGQLQRIAACRRKRPNTSLNVLCVWIHREVTNRALRSC